VLYFLYFPAILVASFVATGEPGTCKIWRSFFPDSEYIVLTPSRYILEEREERKKEENRVPSTLRVTPVFLKAVYYILEFSSTPCVMYQAGFVDPDTPVVM